MHRLLFRLVLNRWTISRLHSGGRSLNQLQFEILGTYAGGLEANVQLLALAS